MKEEYYIGQIFEGQYPKGAADFCNETQTAIITEIEPSEDGITRYEIIAVPERPPMTWEEVDSARIEYRHKMIDTKTIARMRKQANKTWTEEDEQAYLELDAEVTSWIEENLPYPVGEE